MLRSPARVFIPLLLVFAVAGCQTNTPSSVNRVGFKANYLVARAALENGQYGKAERSYANLLNKAGPLESRLRLEYAHTLLRAGKFDKASEEARVVATKLDGRGRGAALAVQATADQEIARKAIDKGTLTADAMQRLVSAKQGFDEVLSNYPDLDPLGGLALRRKTIDIEMSTLR